MAMLPFSNTHMDCTATAPPARVFTSPPSRLFGICSVCNNVPSTGWNTEIRLPSPDIHPITVVFCRGVVLRTHSDIDLFVLPIGSNTDWMTRHTNDIAGEVEE